MGWKLHDLPLHARLRIAEANKKFVPAAPAPSDDPESSLHDYILEHAHSQGWLAIHSRMDKPTTTALGVSDFILVTTQTIMFIEAKRKGGKVTPKQQGFLTAIRSLGWPSAVVYSQEEYLAFVQGK